MVRSRWHAMVVSAPGAGEADAGAAGGGTWRCRTPERWRPQSPGAMAGCPACHCRVFRSMPWCPAGRTGCTHTGRGARDSAESWRHIRGGTGPLALARLMVGASWQFRCPIISDVVPCGLQFQDVQAFTILATSKWPAVTLSDATDASGNTVSTRLPAAAFLCV